MGIHQTQSFQLKTAIGAVRTGFTNSKLLQSVFELQNPQMVEKIFAEIKVIYVERLPIRKIDFSNPADKARHDRMIDLVERMLNSHKQLGAVNTDHQKTHLQRQIDITDAQIDKLVYELYELKRDEIIIVEKNLLPAAT